MAGKFIRHSLMMAILGFGALFVFAPEITSAGACTAKTGSGKVWSSGADWNSGCTGAAGIPGAGDDVTIPTGTIMTLDTNTAAISSLTVEGTLTVGNDATGRSITTGSLTISTSATVSAGATGATHSLSISGNLTDNGTFNGNPAAGRLINATFNGTNQSISGTPTLLRFNNLTIAGTSTTTANAEPTVNGTFAINDGGKYIQTIGTIVPGATKNFGIASTYEWQTGGGVIFPAAPGISFGNLIINTPSGNNSAAGNLTAINGNLQIKNTTAGSYRLGATTSPTLNIAGDIILDAGTLNFSTGTGTPTVNVSGNVTINGGTLQPATSTGAPTFNIAGNWTNNGTFTNGGVGTTTFNGTYNGTNPQILSKNGTGSTETFCNLTISSGSYLDTGDDLVSVTGSGNCTTLTQSGILKRTTPTQDINSGSTFTFTDSRNVPTAQITRTGGTLGNTSVVVISNQSPNASPCGTHTLNGAPILRWYNITPASGGTAIVRLYYRTTNPNETNGTNAGDIRFFHCDGTTWTQLATGSYNIGSDGNGNYVELPGVNTFSPFALAPAGTPTALGLTDFKVKLTPKHYVKVKWETGTELNILEFNVYRQTVGSKKWVKVNANPIPATNPGDFIGAVYSLTDKKVQAGKTYRYKLQIVRLSDPPAWSNIIKIAVPLATPTPRPM